jgi:hypothetical protein
MIFLETEAQEKRCCGPEGCGHKKPINFDQTERFCVAAYCMAWRFVIEKEPLTQDDIRSAGTALRLAGALKPDIQPRRGYCGLAGVDNATVGSEK